LRCFVLLLLLWPEGNGSSTQCARRHGLALLAAHSCLVKLVLQHQLPQLFGGAAPLACRLASALLQLRAQLKVLDTHRLCVRCAAYAFAKITCRSSSCCGGDVEVWPFRPCILLLRMPLSVDRLLTVCVRWQHHCASMCVCRRCCGGAVSSLPSWHFIRSVSCQPAPCRVAHTQVAHGIAMAQAGPYPGVAVMMWMIDGMAHSHKQRFSCALQR
jgi:hypothetical protein